MSQTSGLPGKRLGSSSSQSAPPHAEERDPSPSTSKSTSHPSAQRSSVSMHSSVHGASPATHPIASAPLAPGSQVSLPLQYAPSSQSASDPHVSAPVSGEDGASVPPPPSSSEIIGSPHPTASTITTS